MVHKLLQIEHNTFRRCTKSNWMLSQLRRQEFKNEDWMTKRWILEYCWAFNAFTILLLLYVCYYCYDYSMSVAVSFCRYAHSVHTHAHTQRKFGNKLWSKIAWFPNSLSKILLATIVTFLSLKFHFFLKCIL